MKSLTTAFLRLLGLICLGASPAFGQVAFTFTGTANDTGLGYTMGQTYTFTFTTGASFANNSGSIFNATRNQWQEQYIADDQLWSGISSSGLTGTYAHPTSAETSPIAILKVDSPYTLYISAGANVFLDTIGLLAPNGTAIAGMEFTVEIPAATFSFTSGATTPDNYFAGADGTYTPASSMARVFGPVVFSGSQAEFTITSVTIGATAVPEPSTSVVILGLFALGFAAYRRRAN